MHVQTMSRAGRHAKTIIMSLQKDYVASVMADSIRLTLRESRLMFTRSAEMYMELCFPYRNTVVFFRHVIVELEEQNVPSHVTKLS